MEVEAPTLELLCAVWCVQHDVARERLVAGTAITHPVADVVADVRRWVPPGANSLLWPPAAARAGSLAGICFALGRVPARWRSLINVSEEAARGGHFAIVRWVVSAPYIPLRSFEIMSSLKPLVQTLEIAAGGGHLHIVQWLVDGYHALLTLESIAAAFRGGHVAVVAWFRKEEPDADFGEMWGEAMLSGSIPMVEWMFAHEDVTRAMDHPFLVNYAMLSESVALVNWILDNHWDLFWQGIPESLVARCLNNPDVARAILRRRGAVACVDGALAFAVADNNAAVVAWLLGEREWTHKTLKWAAEGNTITSEVRCLLYDACKQISATKRRRT